MSLLKPTLEMYNDMVSLGNKAAKQLKVSKGYPVKTKLVMISIFVSHIFRVTFVSQTSHKIVIW